MASAGSIYKQLQKLSNEATRTTLNYNREEANTARAWQKEMSDTSHQREVQDLINAGLNPVLSSNQGAQSYTTSAASGQAENAANAVANAYGADRSAAATKAAAASSAAATRYAADQNLKAAQAAAYANMYTADKHYEGVKYSTKNSKSGSIPGVLTNIANSVIKDPKAKSKVNDVIRFFSTDTNKYKKVDADGYSWKNLNENGKNQVEKRFKAAFPYVPYTAYNRKVFIDANLNHSKSAMKKWSNIVQTSINLKNNSSRAYSSGSGIW